MTSAAVRAGPEEVDSDVPSVDPAAAEETLSTQLSQKVCCALPAMMVPGPPVTPLECPPKSQTSHLSSPLLFSPRCCCLKQTQHCIRLCSLILSPEYLSNLRAALMDCSPAMLQSTPFPVTSLS